MSKFEKIGELVQSAGTDAVLLTSMSNLFYATNCHTEGMCHVTAKGEGYAFTDSRYTELLQRAVAGTGWKVFEPEGRNYFAAFKNFTRNICAMKLPAPCWSLSWADCPTSE